MITERVLIVEDNSKIADLWERSIRSEADAATAVERADSYTEALSRAKQGDIAYCILDLNFPERPDSERPDDKVDLGFKLLEEICKLNPFAEIVIASRWADRKDVARMKNDLWFRGLPIRDVFNKNVDADKDALIATARRDLRSLAPLNGFFQQRRIAVLHPLERRLVRRLWDKAQIVPQSWPTPLCMLRGKTGAGKSRWAVEFCELVNFLRPNNSRKPRQELDCGHLSDTQAGVDARIQLFGTRTFQHLPDAAGAFERATTYRGATRNGLATDHSTVDFTSSGTVILQEFGSLPFDCQHLLLTVLDPNEHCGGRVTPAGTGGMTIPIGCSVLLTTNVDIEARVVDSTHASPGDLDEALFQRLARDKDSWIRVPAMDEMGLEVFVEHLRFQLGRFGYSGVDFAPEAERLLQDVFDKWGQSLNVRAAEQIARSFNSDARTAGRRLTHGHIVHGVASLRLPIGEAAHSQPLAKPATSIKVVLTELGLTNPTDAKQFVAWCAFDSLRTVIARGETRKSVKKADVDKAYDDNSPRFVKSTLANAWTERCDIVARYVSQAAKHGYSITIAGQGRGSHILVRLLDDRALPEVEKGTDGA